MSLWLKEREVSAITGRSLSTLRQARSVRKGELDAPQHCRDGGRVFYHADEVALWMRQHGLSVPTRLLPIIN